MDETRSQLKILVVSNNPLSSTENNGKTLASFFKGWKNVSLMQIYFRPEYPDDICITEPSQKMPFFRLADHQVIRRFPGELFELGTEDIEEISEKGVVALPCHDQRDRVIVEPVRSNPFYRSNIRNNTLVKLLRELPWRFYPFKKKNQQLLDALRDFSPDLLFFCAGDAIFAYDITSMLLDELGCPVVLYITDDYIMPYSDISPMARYRRWLIRNHFIKMAKRSSGVFTIGEKMQSVYKEHFGIDSYCLVNMSEDHYSPVDYRSRSASAPLKIVYVGGLHLNRHVAISHVIEAIQRVNQSEGRKVFELDIYAPNNLPEKELQALNTIASRYLGLIAAEEVTRVSQDADILLFVESGELRYIRATSLSLSTKVPEYLSYHRAILNIGSLESSSVAYLKERSFWANDDVDEIETVLTSISGRPELLQEMADKAYRTFAEKHAQGRLFESFRNLMMGIIDGKKRVGKISTTDEKRAGVAVAPLKSPPVKPSKKGPAPLRILQIVIALDRNGIDSVVMDLYRHIDHERFQFDFLVFSPKEGDFEAEVKALGGRVYHIPERSKHPFLSQKLLKHFFRHRSYPIVHAHQDCLSGGPLKFACRSGVPIRIAHAHTTNLPSGIRHWIYDHARHNIPRYANYFLGCTERAGKWMFGEKVVRSDRFKVLKNAIDVSIHGFDPSVREKTRASLTVGRKKLILNVGRLAYAKNQGFLLQIFEELCKRRDDVMLTIAGDGELSSQLTTQISELGLEGKAVLLGSREDVPELMQAADLMVMPSLFEGLPLTCIESQCTGLYTIISDTIDPIVRFTPLIESMDLKEGPTAWAERIDEILEQTDPSHRTAQKEATIQNHFDIRSQSARLADYYDALLSTISKESEVKRS